jgi:hypothetical protein
MCSDTPALTEDSGITAQAKIPDGIAITLARPNNGILTFRIDLQSLIKVPPMLAIAG